MEPDAPHGAGLPGAAATLSGRTGARSGSFPECANPRIHLHHRRVTCGPFASPAFGDQLVYTVILSVSEESPWEGHQNARRLPFLPCGQRLRRGIPPVGRNDRVGRRAKGLLYRARTVAEVASTRRGSGRTVRRGSGSTDPKWSVSLISPIHRPLRVGATKEKVLPENQWCPESSVRETVSSVPGVTSRHQVYRDQSDGRICEEPEKRQACRTHSAVSGSDGTGIWRRRRALRRWTNQATTPIRPERANPPSTIHQNHPIAASPSQA